MPGLAFALCLDILSNALALMDVHTYSSLCRTESFHVWVCVGTPFSHMRVYITAKNLLLLDCHIL